MAPRGGDKGRNQRNSFLYGTNQAVGLNGILALFHKKIWNIVEAKVVQMVKQFWERELNLQKNKSNADCIRHQGEQS